MAALIRRVLTPSGTSWTPRRTGSPPSRLATTGDYDVAIVDRMLPGHRRPGGHPPAPLAKGIQTPVLMLTALGSVEQRVARSRCRRRRLPAQAVRVHGAPRPRPRARPARWFARPSTRLAAGDVELDESRHTARVGERSVDLSAREFALLGFLIRHQGQVLTRRQILDGVWGAEPDVYSNVVDLYVHYLRRKLGELGRSGRLRTVRGVGYSLRADG